MLSLSAHSGLSNDMAFALGGQVWSKVGVHPKPLARTWFWTLWTGLEIVTNACIVIKLNVQKLRVFPPSFFPHCNGGVLLLECYDNMSSTNTATRRMKIVEWRGGRQLKTLFDAFQIGFPRQTTASHSKSVIFRHWPKIFKFVTLDCALPNLIQLRVAL